MRLWKFSPVGGHISLARGGNWADSALAFHLAIRLADCSSRSALDTYHTALDAALDSQVVLGVTNVHVDAVLL